jgi:hypothetical protein
LKEIQYFVDYLSAISSAQRTEWSLVRLTGMTHCASFSGMEQFGSGSRGTVNCFTLPAIFACSGNSQNYVPRCWRWLGNCCLRPQAKVLKSSPAPRINSFDCSLNRHEITVYCWLSFWIVSFCTVSYDLLLIVFLDCEFFCAGELLPEAEGKIYTIS